ncbi:SusC/RagA family TonB-linked outer membrane protein [Parabacteroides sp. OttesenSCG-928-N08]|nr:SusC/RagA family TonB-linked outer membrane protein [Parabacteroides sp. OttesenSCG-928-N08]
MRKFLHALVFFLLISTFGFSQQKVSGVVISADDNEPIIGAAVVVKNNPSVGAATDLDGRFTLTVPEGFKTLVISYIGMKQLEVPVKEYLEVMMQSDTQLLGEVVVTGMQQMDKRLFTGAATKIDATTAKLDGVADISRSLEGRAAGVSVQSVSGTFGAAPKIRIRGATSIYGNSRPLWVVDGVIMEDNIDISSDDLSSGNAETLVSSAIAGINADDIESIQILKDGSATSIYGARAMAGVVVVTTKRGQAGVSRISYTGEFTLRMKPKYKDYNITNSQEQMGIYKEMADKGWLEFAGIASSPNSGVYGKMYEKIGNWTGGTDYELRHRQQDMNNYLRHYEYLNTDWFDELFNASVMQNHAISISSGTEKAQFYLSLSAMNDPGWTKSSSVERYTFNANGSYKIYPNLTLSLIGNGSRRDQKAPGTLSQEVDPVSGQVKRGFDINPYNYALNTSRTLDPSEYYRRNYAPFNIFHELDNNYIDLNVTDVKFQGELEWKIMKGWDIKGLGSIRYSNNAYEHHIKDHSNMAMAYRAGVKEGEGGEDEMIRSANPYLYTDPDNSSALPETILPKGGIYNRTTNALKDLYARLSTSYVTELNEKHLINLFGGMDMSSTERNRTWFRGWGYQYDKGGSPFYDYMVFKQGKEENTEYYSNNDYLSRNVAFFGTGTYSYQGKYVLNGTLRYEGTNKLGKSRQSRWLPTWNVSGAWNAHEETWYSAVRDVLSHATLKASYSLTADSGPVDVSNALPIFGAYTPWRPFASVMESGIRLVTTENSELTFEKKYELNIGADIGFLDDRITLAADAYWRNDFDLIGQIYTTGEGGGNILKWANVADMKSSGIELSLFTQNIKTKDFGWSTSFIFSKSTNKITSLDSDAQMLDLVKGVGYPLQDYPVRALFSIPFLRLNNEGLPVFLNEKGEETTSDIYFQENKNLDFLKYEGPTDPTMVGSFGNDLSYKNFRLNIFLTYSFGNVVRMDPYFSNSYSDLSAMPREFKNRWMVPGDEEYTNVPVIASVRQNGNNGNLSYAYNAYNYSTERVAKGDFIRLKEISLSYDMPKKLISALKFQNMSLKLQATNLFLLYADKKLNGQDPEFFNAGGVATPMPKQFTLTVRFGL